MQFGICNEIFQGWSFAETFSFVAKTGYDVVEIAPFTMGGLVTDISGEERRKIREEAWRAGVRISGLHWVLAQTEGIFLNSPDRATRFRSGAYLGELVDCAADLGGTRVILGSPKQRQVGEGTDYGAAWDWAVETLGDAVKRAEDRGVIICVEPLGSSETNFINTAAEARRFAEAFSSGAISTILDVKAMSSEGLTIPEIIGESRGRFEYFHANDVNLKGPGFGDVDYLPIVEALRGVGYDGVISVEVFLFEEGPKMIAEKSLRYLREVFGVEG